MVAMDLIPGLPDEIARECLIRVPYNHFHTLTSIGKLWKEEVESPAFHLLKKSRCLTRAVIALAQAETTPSPSSDPAKKLAPSTPAYRLTLYEPDADTWHTLPPIPGFRHHGLPLFCQIAGAGRELVLIGGWDPESWAASDQIFVYDFVSATWRAGARMPGPRRSFFACASSGADRVVFVAGGHDEDKNAIRSALAYDVGRNDWVPMPDMARERDECKGVFRRGRFHVIGGYCTEMQGRFSKCSEAFDVATWSWGPVEEETLDSAMCPSACVAADDGRLCLCTEGHVAVLDGTTWRSVAALPEEIRVVTQVVAWEGKVMVMGPGRDGGGLSAYVKDLEKGKGGHTWRKAELPLEYSGHVQYGCCLDI